MDAGVPIRSHVSGIAMGLVYAEGKYVTLPTSWVRRMRLETWTSKLGTEDAITALQLDTKIDGIPAEVLRSSVSAGQRGSDANTLSHE